MKQTKIDLLEPFEKVLDGLLAIPENHKTAAKRFVPVPQTQFAIGAKRDSAGETELRDVLRCLHDAAHGRLVAIERGTVAIAPSVAASLNESPFHAGTQAGFLLEALTRIISGALRSNTGTLHTQTGNCDAFNHPIRTDTSSHQAVVSTS